MEAGKFDCFVNMEFISDLDYLQFSVQPYPRYFAPNGTLAGTWRRLEILTVLL